MTREFFLGNTCAAWGERVSRQIWFVLAATAVTFSLASSQPFKADRHTIALWHFDEGSGTTLHDASRNHNDGEIHHCRWAAGKFRSGLVFDGRTSYVSLPISSSLQPRRAFTIEAWFKLDTLYKFAPPTAEGDLPVLFGCLGSYPGGGGYQLSFASDGIVFSYRSPFSQTRFAPIIRIDQAHRFYKVMATYQSTKVNGADGALVRLYLDGQLMHQITFPAPIQYANVSMFTFGSNIDGVAEGHRGMREFPGMIDEVRISNVVRVPTQPYRPHRVHF